MAMPLDFELPTADGKSKVKLSGLIGEKPVVLILGNYTCGPFPLPVHARSRM